MDTANFESLGLGLTRLGLDIQQLCLAIERNTASMQRLIDADEQMAALGQSLMPNASQTAPEPIDVDALDWRNDGNGGYTVEDGIARRPATDAEAAAIRASIKPRGSKRR